MNLVLFQTLVSTSCLRLISLLPLFIFLVTAPTISEASKAELVVQGWGSDATYAGKTNPSIVTSVAFSPDGNTVASGYGNSVMIWNVKTGNLVGSIVGKMIKVNSVAFMLDGEIIAAGGLDNNISLWDAVAFNHFATLTGHKGPVSSVVFSPDGATIASGSVDHTVQLWDIRKGKLVAILNGHNGPVSSVVFSPDGNTIASGGEDNTVRLWNVKTGEMFASLDLPDTHDGYVNIATTVVFSPDGKTVAVGNLNNTVRFWDASTGKPSATIFTIHKGTISTIAYSPDGKTMALGCSDKTVQLWNIKSGQLAATLSGHEDQVSSIAFSPNGETLASGSWDGTVRLWDLENWQQLETMYVLPGEKQWFTLRPGRLVFAGSAEADKYIGVRFNGLLRQSTHSFVNNYLGAQIESLFWPIYPMAYYADQLHVKHLDMAVSQPDPAIEPRRFLYWWDETKGKGLFFTVMVTLIGVFYRQFLHPRSFEYIGLSRFIFDKLKFSYRKVDDELGLVHDFFDAAGLSPQRNMDGVSLLLSGEDSPAVAVFGTIDPDYNHIQSIAFGTHYDRVYLIIGHISHLPTPSEIQALRWATGIPVIPITTGVMEHALWSGIAVGRVKEINEYYLLRQDPYHNSMPVDDPFWFFGRTDLLSDIPRSLAQGHHVGVFGLRKVGKTSVLRQVEQRFGGVPVVTLDCQKYSPKADVFFEVILQELTRVLEKLGLEPPSPPQRWSSNATEVFREHFLQAFDKWHQTGRSEPVILIFDEIDKLFSPQGWNDSDIRLREYVKLFQVLRGIAQADRALVTLVTAYRPAINRRNILSPELPENPMYMTFKEIHLGFLTPAETGEMIRALGTNRDIEWETGAAEMVYRYCAGHPFLCRLFASEVSQAGKLKLVSLQRVEEAATEVTKTLRKNEIGNYYHESVWETLEENERKSLLWSVGTPEKLPEPGSPAELALNAVEQFGLVSESDGKLNATGEFLRQWIERRL